MYFKTLIFLMLFFFAQYLNGQYYDFPFIGLEQTFTSHTWTGVQTSYGLARIAFDKDTILDQKRYVTAGQLQFRNENGKVYQRKYDYQLQEYYEDLEFDFSLEIGDRFKNYLHREEDTFTVVAKDKVVNMIGDSVWQLKLEFMSNWITYDTLTWIEGVGNVQSGLIKTFFPDGGYIHSCTHLANNQKLYVNSENINYCNCTYAYGVDDDNDGFGNYIPRSNIIDLRFSYNNPEVKKSYKHKRCDTLIILSDDIDFISVYYGSKCKDGRLHIDSTWVTDTGKYAFRINDDLSGDALYLSNSCTYDYAQIYLFDCFENDCDDNNPSINSAQIEIPNNDIDENCDGIMLVIDVDQDGVNSDLDCDDTNANISPNEIEIPYNGIDDDCNVLTLDDDLDEDGFIFSDDCDDTNADINPDGVEIPNNDIDEDCDGEDLLSSQHNLSGVSFNVFPNPASHFIFIKTNTSNIYVVKMYSYNGDLVSFGNNVTRIDLESLPSGVYILEIELLESQAKVYDVISINK